MIGKDTTIGDDVKIGQGVMIGQTVTVQTGACIADFTQIAANAVVTGGTCP